MIEILVYKQGNLWISNEDGFVISLPPRLVTRKDVISYFEEINRNLLVGEEPYKVIFCK